MLKKIYCLLSYLFLIVLVMCMVYSLLAMFNIVEGNNLLIPGMFFGVLYQRFDSKCNNVDD